jgi:hypothetical protein
MKVRILLSMSIGFALAAAAAAQTKVSGVIQCGNPEGHAVDIGDRPNHTMNVSKVSCTWTKAMDMAGSQTKDGFSASAEETTGDKSSGSGFHWGNMSNGDKYYVRFEGTTTWKDGKPQSAEGTWRYAGGTGKLKGIRGKGTYKCAAPNADGSMSYDVEGEYQIP